LPTELDPKAVTITGLRGCNHKPIYESSKDICTINLTNLPLKLVHAPLLLCMDSEEKQACWEGDGGRLSEAVGDYMKKIRTVMANAFGTWHTFLEKCGNPLLLVSAQDSISAKGGSGAPGFPWWPRELGCFDRTYTQYSVLEPRREAGLSGEHRGTPGQGW